MDDDLIRRIAEFDMGKLDAALDVNEAVGIRRIVIRVNVCLLYTSDAADD